MSLLKWKELAEKKTKAGQNMNLIREAIKQKKIVDTMGESESEKLFKPITKSLKTLSGPDFKKIGKKKLTVPDYNINDEDDITLAIKNMFDTGVEPQKEKQITTNPPSYEEVMKGVLQEAAFGKKEDPGDEDEDDDEDEEFVGPDYSIHEDDEVETVLDELNLRKYYEIQEMLKDESSEKTKQNNLQDVIKGATFRRNQLKGYKSQITKLMKKGQISQPEAQLRNKVIADTKKVLDDYIKFNKQKMNSITGSGMRGGSLFIMNPGDAIKKLDLIAGSISAGNNNINLRNDGVGLLDMLFRNSIINKSQYNEIYKNFFS